MWTVYILLCCDNTLYTGIALDLDKRLAMHASGKGAKYMRSRLPFKLAYSEKVENRNHAQKREIQIKRLPREKKLALAGLHPSQDKS